MRYDKIVIQGSLGAGLYLNLSDYVSHTLANKQKVDTALANGETVYSWEYPPEALILVLSSGGGEVLGLLPAMNDLRRLSESIPVIGIAYGQTCSAAAMLLTAASTVTAIEGTVVGSLGVAFSLTTPSKGEDGSTSYYYTTHTGKMTMLPGENKSPQEIEAYIKALSDNQFSQIEAFMENRRPGIGAEIASLNGSVFTVGSNSKQSRLFDYTASSVQEVLSTIEATNMKNFLRLIPGNRKPTSLAANAVAAEGSPQASISFKAAEQAAQGDTTAQFKAFKTELLADADFAKAVATQVVAAMTASSSTPSEDKAAPSSAPTAEVATVADLMAMGAKLKASQQDVLTLAELGVTKEQAPKLLQALVAARDGSAQQHEGSMLLADKGSLTEDEQESGVTALVTGLQARIAKLKKA